MKLDAARVLSHRARRAALDRRAEGALAAAEAVAALHGTDPATVHLSVWARGEHRPLAEVASELRTALEERALVQVLAMRRTLHVVPAEEVPAALGVAKARLYGPQRRQVDKLLALCERPCTYEALAAGILDALADGDLESAALCERVPGLGQRVDLLPDKPYGGMTSVARYVLEAMGGEGLVIRARPLGGWRASGSTWARVDRWLPGAQPLPPAEAYPRVLRRWVRAFGPATPADAAWWTGLPKRDIAAAAAALGDELVEVGVHGWSGTRWVLADDLDALATPAEPLGPVLLPALDPSAMAVTDRTPFLDPSWTDLFDRSGNIAPTVWVDGRIAGGWACRKDGEVVFRLLDPTADAAAVRAEAERLQEALAGEVVQPRFPTPLVKDLAAA